MTLKGVNFMTNEKLFAKSDMAKRWGVSRQLVNGWSVRQKDFPTPVDYVSDGRTPLFTLSQVEAYEKKHNLRMEGNRND